MCLQERFVVRSGDGFLKEATTGEMVANRLIPDAAIADAHCFAAYDEAELVAETMRQRGLEAVVVSAEQVAS